MRPIAQRWMRLSLLPYALIACLWSAAVATALAAGTPPGVAIQADVMVPMRDGVKLATDVYLPARDGVPLAERLPAILMRTPYNKSPGDRPPSDALYFAGHGYAVVFQDVRGRYKSEGVWHWLTDDGLDGLDTAAWIARQPWSNGKLGTIGTSYVGGTQHALALEKCPQLVTAIPVDAMSQHGLCRRAERRGLRAAVLELDLFGHRPERQPPGPRPGHRGRAQTDDGEPPLQYLFQLPAPPRHDAAEAHSGIRRLAGRGHVARGQRRLLEAKRHPRLRRTSTTTFRSTSSAAGTTRGAGNTAANFVGPEPQAQGPRLSDHGPLDSRPAGQVVARPGQFRPGRGHSRRRWPGTCDWYDHWLKGDRQRAWASATRLPTPVRIFVMGSRRRAQDRRRGCSTTADSGATNASGPWPARNTPLLSCSREDKLSRQPSAPERRAGRASNSIPPTSGADHRRQHFLGRRHSAAGGVGPAGRPARLERSSSRSALGPQRRAGVSDRAAGRRLGSDRPDRT